MIGFWATLSLNMPDFTRFGRSQKEQTIGQVIALPTAMAVFSTMGVVITSCAAVIYPAAKMSELWDPVKLIGRFTDPYIVVIASRLRVHFIGRLQFCHLFLLQCRFGQLFPLK